MWFPLGLIFWETVGNTSSECIASSIDLLPSPQVKTTAVSEATFIEGRSHHSFVAGPSIVPGALRPERLLSPETGEVGRGRQG